MTPINPYVATHTLAAAIMSWLHPRNDELTFSVTYANLTDYLLEHLDEWLMTDEPDDCIVSDFLQSHGTIDKEYIDGFKRRRSARYHQLISIDTDLLPTPRLNDLLAGRNVIGEKS